MIPPRTLETINDYIEKGWEPGDFVRAVLENNLARSFACADIHNRAAMFDIVKHVWNTIPANAWGSPQRVEAWIKSIKEQENGTP